MALIDDRSSDPTDPLQLNSLLSFCHRTFKDFPAPNDSDDFDSLHNFLKLTGLNKSDKLFDDAKAVVSSEFSGSELEPTAASEKNDEDVTKTKRNLEERRPDLGLKRARPSFCLKPDKGPPSVSLETTLDIDKLQDPDEFFSAFYKHECIIAREEIERQTGGNMIGENKNKPPANQRHRRPSLLGKQASYKHKYSFAIPEEDGTSIASQETSVQDNLISSSFVSQEHNVASQEGESGSVSNFKNVAGGTLDEILSQDIEDLDGDGALLLLQEHLQIKPVDVDKCLHDFSYAGNIDIMDLEEEMSVRRKALSDIQNVVKESIKENPAGRKQVNRNKSDSLMYSTPPKRLSAASSLFGEGKSLPKPFHFPFSAADLDLSPAKSPTYEHFTDNLGTINEPSIHGQFKLQADDEAKNPACVTPGSKQMMPGYSCLEKSASIDFNTRTEDSHCVLVDKNECNHHAQVGEILHETVSFAQPDVGNDELARGSPETAVQAHGFSESEKTHVQDGEILHETVSSAQPDVGNDELAGGSPETAVQAHGFSESEKTHVQDGEILHETVSSAQPDVGNDELARGSPETAVQAHGLSESEKTVENIHQGASTRPDADIVDPATANSMISQSELGNKEPIAAEDKFMDGCTSNAESGVEQQNKEHPEISLKDRRKAGRAHGSRERKALSCRQSLAAAGTSRNSGVRQSNRNKIRPLEYWKGETVLRGRIHESNKEPIAAEDKFMDGCTSNAESGVEQQNKEHPEISLKDRRKAGRAHGSRKRKALSCTQSLAAAGTSWNSGVRRSNRNKIRPLEYWKGERVLRGRIHESLDTVIGIKCISTPSPGRKVPRFKVTSYVSDEHNELVQSVALH